MDTLWFEVALVSTAFAFGHIFFGHFEERTPKWRRALKLLLFIAVAVGLSWSLGRPWALAFLGTVLLLVVLVHAVWLPSKGINGWTGEPKDRYYELRGWPLE